MTDLSDVLLSAVVTYGAPFFGLFLLLAAAGVPIPTTLLVIAVGAFIRQGFMDLPQAALLGLAGAVLGDSISFGIGWLAGNWLERRYGSSVRWQRARLTFTRNGGMAIYLTRFLLTALSFPVNLIAGGSAYRYRRFLLFATAGEATWILLYGSLGYLFGSQWELISEFINNFSGLTLGITILALGIYLYLRRVRAARAQSGGLRTVDTARRQRPGNS